jgi:hypothetical protein
MQMCWDRVWEVICDMLEVCLTDDGKKGNCGGHREKNVPAAV